MPFILILKQTFEIEYAHHTVNITNLLITSLIVMRRRAKIIVNCGFITIFFPSLRISGIIGCYLLVSYLYTHPNTEKEKWN